MFFYTVHTHVCTIICTHTCTCIRTHTYAYEVIVTNNSTYGFACSRVHRLVLHVCVSPLILCLLECSLSKRPALEEESDDAIIDTPSVFGTSRRRRKKVSAIDRKKRNKPGYFYAGCVIWWMVGSVV